MKEKSKKYRKTLKQKTLKVFTKESFMTMVTAKDRLLSMELKFKW